MEASEKALFKELRREQSIDHSAVKALLESGVDVNVRSYDGVTPIILAAESGDKTVLKMLLAYGADLHAKSESGYTVLMAAAYRLRPSTVELLLSKGADATILDEFGRSALEYADQACLEELSPPFYYDPFPDANKIETLLTEAGAEPQDIDENTPWFIASTQPVNSDIVDEQTTSQATSAEGTVHMSSPTSPIPFVVSPQSKFPLPRTILMLALTAILILSLAALVLSMVTGS